MYEEKRRMEVIADVVSEKFGLPVNLVEHGPSTAWYDGKALFLSRVQLAEVMKSVKDKCVKYLLYHESAHALFTDMTALEAFKQVKDSGKSSLGLSALGTKIVKEFLNAMEDVRVEILVSKKYDGVKLELSTKLQEYAEAHEKQAKATFKQVSPMSVMLAIILKYRVNTLYTKYISPELDKVMNEIADLTDKIMDCKNTQEVIKLSMDVYERVKKYFKSSKCPDDSEGEEKGKVTGERYILSDEETKEEETKEGEREKKRKAIATCPKCGCGHCVSVAMALHKKDCDCPCHKKESEGDGGEGEEESEEQEDVKGKGKEKEKKEKKGKKTEGVEGDDEGEDKKDKKGKGKSDGDDGDEEGDGDGEGVESKADDFDDSDSELTPGEKADLRKDGKEDLDGLMEDVKGAYDSLYEKDRYMDSTVLPSIPPDMIMQFDLGDFYPIFSRAKERDVEEVVSHYQLDVYNRLKAKIDGATRVIQARIRDMFTLKTKSHYESGHRSGRLISTKDLWKTGVGSDRVFMKRYKEEENDYAISVLIDQSGSMSGPKIDIAKESLIALSETLHELHIPFEVLGFSTTGGAHPDHEDKTTPREEIRFDGLHHMIYKTFDDRFEDTVKSRIGSIYAGGNNWDGEAVLWAYKRLAAHKAREKILIVLSDGYPSGTNSNHKNCSFTRATVKNIERFVKVIGIGLHTTAVEEFYKDNVVVNDIEELPNEFCKILYRILSSPMLARV